jgi:MYXO-CTERM domain-containing protein
MGATQRGLASTGVGTGLVVVLLLLAACGFGAAGPPTRVTVARRSASASSSPLVTYKGGRVLSDADIVVVFWGGTVPSAVVDATPEIYRTITGIDDFDWISEYDTPAQHIGRARLVGQTTIDPGDAGTDLFEGQIVAELIRQLDAGALPPATDDSYYAVYFPPGVTIRAGIFEDRSCHEWQAYHGDLAPDVPGTYAVFPGCGQSSPNAVHELFEAMTDPHDNDGWTTQAGDEIADLCASSLTSLPLADGGTFGIQRLWSDVANACLGSGNEFTLSIDPAAAVADPVVSFTLSMSPPRNPFTQLSWGVSGLPTGGTYSIAQRTDGSGRFTLTLDLPQPSQGARFTVEGRTESWKASAVGGLYLASSSSGAAGCSQASGTSWPVGLVALIGLVVLGRRRRS